MLTSWVAVSFSYYWRAEPWLALGKYQGRKALLKAFVQSTIIEGLEMVQRLRGPAGLPEIACV